MVMHIVKHGGKTLVIVSIKMIRKEISGIHAQIMGTPIIPKEDSHNLGDSP